MDSKLYTSMAKSLADLLMVSPETGARLGFWNVGNSVDGRLCIGLGDPQGREFWILKTEMTEASEFEVKALKVSGAPEVPPAPENDKSADSPECPGPTHYAGCACHERGWENKWQSAVDMAARAELERDEWRDRAKAAERTVDNLNEAVERAVDDLNALSGAKEEPS